ncbi:amidohydrolase [bacterium]|nr:MAG: amidohydrolase [bacterium]
MFKKIVLGLFVSCMMLSVAHAQQKGSVLIKNATVITAAGEDLQNTDVLIKDGIISEIGKDLKAPKGVETIDATGKYVMPGIIDAHSHLAVTRGINEWTNPVSAEVSMEDVINPNDEGMYAALAGGVTTIHVMHGSANVIGGQGETIKLRYGMNQDDLKFQGAPRTIKFALGENPTRVHGQGFGVQPRTRMGVEQIVRTTFDAAKDYKVKREAYLDEYAKWAKRKKGLEPDPVARNYRYDVINDILAGKVLVHCHSYRADEILMLMRVFNDYGVKNYTFQHVLEGFKVAPEMAKNGAHGSTFSDWWAYKFEVYYASAYNAAIMNKYGVVTSINSDSEELIRHLNHEAAKVVKYGGTSIGDAIKMITINPAKQLGIDKQVGSIEKGKQADLAIWSAHPFSIYAICEQTFVDGVSYFNRATDPDDMRLVINPEEDYKLHETAGREVDACMSGVFEFLGTATDSHSHN